MVETNNQQQDIGLSSETKGLLRSYFDAFANLYGIVPLYRALRIVQKQNPELVLTTDTFLAFADQVGQEEHPYIIAGAEDIYSNIDEPIPPLKREIIAEYLYAVDDFESYAELKANQEGKPFYIPEKEELLRYQDDFYVEETKESLALGAFLRDKLKVKNMDDVLSDLHLEASIGDSDPQDLIDTVERLAGRGCLGSTEQINEFFRYYYDMSNHTRMAANRGFTPNEIQERMGIRSSKFGIDIPRVLQTGDADMGVLRQGALHSSIPATQWGRAQNSQKQMEQQKPGRNTPCPCGSGKKYKRCCGR